MTKPPTARDPSHLEELVRQREQRLRESEQNFRSFFETALDLIVVATPEGRLLYANPAVERVLGYSAAELLTMHVLDLNLPADRPEAEGIFGAMIRGERSHCPLPLHHKDGHGVPAETRMWFGRWDGHDCVFGVMKDLSAEVEAQQRFERLFRNNTALMAVTRLPGQTLEDVNDTWLETLGYRRDEVIGKTTAELGLIVDTQAQNEAARMLQSEGRFRDVELKVRRKDGVVLDGLFAGEIISSQGRQYFLTVMVDITGRKAAERTLQEERRRLANIIEGTHVGTWAWNVRTGETVFNDIWAQILGYTLDELAPISIDTWTRLAHPDDLKLSGELLARHFSGELEYYDAECRMRHKDGHWVWVHDRGRVVTWTDDGRPLMMFGTHTDISSAKSIQEALRNAREAADSASRAKTAFLANMSHEIRTPLHAIQGLSHVLRQEVSEPRNRDRLDKVSSAASHLLHIIDDILDLSKIEEGRVTLENVEFDAPRVFGEACSMVSDRLAARGVAFDVDLGELPAQLRGDGMRLRQILLNFLSNAAKFTEAGRVGLRARVVSRDAVTTRLRVEVSDTGIGMTREQMARLFQPFEQADASITRKYGGTGLGLVISRHLTAMMKGEIGCDSEPGRGSTFWFEVPLGTVATGPVAAGATRVGAVTAHQAFADLARERSLRLLLVEDNELNREVALDLLATEGLVVDAAVDGIDALERAGRERYDLVLMDLHMPRMNGLDATRSLRTVPGYAQTPIVAMTASAFDDDRAACLATGMNDFVSKPVEPDRLYTTLLRWLEPAAAASVARTPVVTPAAPATPAAPSPAPDTVPRPVTPAELRDRLATIEGLDVAAGLRWAGEQVPLYVRLLGQFCETQVEDLATLEEHLAAGDREAARLLAHSLKGVAAVLAMPEVQAQATAVDLAFKQGLPEAEIAARIDELKQGVARIVAKLARVLPPSESPR